MWGLNLRHKETLTYSPSERNPLILKIEANLKQANFKNIKVSDYLITAEKSTPFKFYFFGGLSSKTYLTISLTEEGSLIAECSVTKGPGTDWGYCKKEVIKFWELISI